MRTKKGEGRMDIYCPRCGEPWDVFSLREDMTWEERKRFKKGEGCPICYGKWVCPRCLHIRKSLTLPEEFLKQYPGRCELCWNIPDENLEKFQDRMAKIRAAFSLLDPDTDPDGIASLLDE